MKSWWNWDMYNYAPKDYDCPFCKLIKGQEIEHNQRADIVFEDKNTLAVISPKWWPNNPGGVMVIPKKHYENIYDIPEDWLAAVYKTGKKIAVALKEVYQCEGVSMRQHNEPAGNQDVWHFHLQVLPRYKNDKLYQRHEEAKFVGEKEKQAYAEKLKKYFASAE
jgi:histidine triad (HIT) family protein